MRRSLSLLHVDHIEPQEHIIHVGKDADQDPTVLLLSASFGHNQAQRLYRTSCIVCVHLQEFIKCINCFCLSSSPPPSQPVWRDTHRAPS